MPRPARVASAVVAHGAGSTAEFVARAFGPPMRAAGCTLEPLQDWTGDVTVVERAISDLVRRTGAGLVGGVSLGAHAVARLAASPHRPPLHGLLLVMPAWIGDPGSVGRSSLLAAEAVERLGVQGALLAGDDGSWVAAELGRAWPTYGSALPAALRAAARSPGPTRRQLRVLRLPVGVVGLRDDPFHPVAVARAWAAHIPGAGYVELAPQEPAHDVAVLGRAALAALAAARP